jgi:nascent polypeptide-associated complex subunit alpha
MFPGMGRMNPRQMQGMLKQFGIKTEEINAKRVVFELEDGKRLVIEGPSVSIMNAQGQKIYSVMGGTEKSESAGIPAEDVKMVAEQAGVSEEKATRALEETKGDIAEAITKLKK